MWRAIGGVILGYLAMAVFVSLSFTAVYLAMGADRAYQPGTFEVSTTWIAISFILSFTGAILGGLVCVLIARSPRPAMVLAGLVLVLGAANVVFEIQRAKNPPPAREDDVSIIQATRESRQPVWVAVITPVVGALGVLVGARLKKCECKAAA
jgi:hypothetical protein